MLERGLAVAILSATERGQRELQFIDQVSFVLIAFVIVSSK